MIDSSAAFSGFSVDDVDRAREFYEGTLGLEVEDVGPGMLRLRLGSGARVLLYARPGHRPAEYTVLNFAVRDVTSAVRELTALGVRFERYDGFPQDDDGVMRDRGPDIAWFTDPAGNVLSVIEADEVDEADEADEVDEAV